MRAAQKTLAATVGCATVLLGAAPATGATGTTALTGLSRVSVSTTVGIGNRDSSTPAVSASGRHVAFDSWASKLVRIKARPEL